MPPAGRLTYQAICPLRKELWLDVCLGDEARKDRTKVSASWGGGEIILNELV
jgi:hypothetical protein